MKRYNSIKLILLVLCFLFLIACGESQYSGEYQKNSQNVESAGVIKSSEIITTQKSVGDVVEINENGIAVEFIIVDYNYKGNVLLLRKNPIENPCLFTVDTNNTFKYERSNIDKFLSEYYIDLLGVVKDEIVPVNIEVTDEMYGGFDLKSIKRKCFLLSHAELGFSNHEHAPKEGSVVEYFKNGADKNRATNNSYWTRTPYFAYANVHWSVSTDGSAGAQGGTYTNGIRPAFCVSKDNPILNVCITV